MADGGIAIRVSGVVQFSLHNTPEEHYWDEKLRAELDDKGRWRPEEGPAAAHRRALDRALLLGPPRG